MKKYLVAACLVVIFLAVSLRFWYNEWIYTLRIHVLQKYHVLKQGEHIDITGRFSPKKNGPVFLHFFNPDCPCSRFNIPQFKSLVKEYADKINFAVVVMTKDKNYNEKKIQKKFG